jgi:hypothetical protein
MVPLGNCSSWGFVSVFAEYQGDLFVGGAFYGSGILRWDGSSWSAIAEDGLTGTLRSTVWCLEIYQGDLVAGGYFSRPEAPFGSGPGNIARWNGSRWRTMGMGLNGNVLSLATKGRSLFVGGSFRRADCIPSRSIARWAE